MERPSFELRKIRDLGEVINDTFLFAKQNIKPLLKAYVVICGFFIVASLASGILNQINLLDGMEDGVMYNQQDIWSRLLNPLYGLSLLFKALTYIVIELTAISYVAAYASKGNVPPTVEEVWNFVKYYFFRVLGCNIVVGFIVGLGFLLCVIPGVYLWPMFSLVIPIVVIENGGLNYAMTRSFHLVKNNYWMTLGVSFVMILIVLACKMIFVLPISIFTIGSFFASGHKFSYTGTILTIIADHICLMFYMLLSIAVTMNYYNLVEKKEGTGLMERIDSFGQKDTDTRDHSSEQY